MSDIHAYRPGGAIAVRQEKLRAVTEALGYKWGEWHSLEDYNALCELAGVEPEVTVYRDRPAIRSTAGSISVRPMREGVTNPHWL